jgi:alpha-D-ribose 1-methylphosphonate 5-triphosphate synthase subunit PhnH
VFLSEQYLSSVESAEAVTRQLLQAYAAAGVVPLLESAVKSEAELQAATRLLGWVDCSGAQLAAPQNSP